MPLFSKVKIGRKERRTAAGAGAAGAPARPGGERYPRAGEGLREGRMEDAPELRDWCLDRCGNVSWAQIEYIPTCDQPMDVQLAARLHSSTRSAFVRMVEGQYQVPSELRLDRFAVYSREEAVSATLCEAFVRRGGDEQALGGALQASLESGACAFGEIGGRGESQTREWQRLSWLCLAGGRVITRQDLEVFALSKKPEELRKYKNVGEFLRRGLACSLSEFPIPPAVVGELAIPEGIAAPPCQALRFLAGGMRGRNDEERARFETLVAAEVACCLLHGAALDLQAFGYVPVLPATVIMFIDRRVMPFFGRLRLPGRAAGSLMPIMHVLKDVTRSEDNRYVERHAWVEGPVLFAYPPTPRASAVLSAADASRRDSGGSTPDTRPPTSRLSLGGSDERAASRGGSGEVAPRASSVDAPGRYFHGAVAPRSLSMSGARLRSAPAPSPRRGSGAARAGPSTVMARAVAEATVRSPPGVRPTETTGGSRSGGDGVAGAGTSGATVRVQDAGRPEKDGGGESCAAVRDGAAGVVTQETVATHPPRMGREDGSAGAVAQGSAAAHPSTASREGGAGGEQVKNVSAAGATDAVMTDAVTPGTGTETAGRSAAVSGDDRNEGLKITAAAAWARPKSVAELRRCALSTPLLREVAPYVDRAAGPLMQKETVNLCELLQRLSGWIRDVPGGVVEPRPRARRSHRRGRRGADGDDAAEPGGSGRSMSMAEMTRVMHEQEAELRQAYARLSQRTRVMCCNGCDRCEGGPAVGTRREREETEVEGRNVRARRDEATEGSDGDDGVDVVLRDG